MTQIQQLQRWFQDVPAVCMYAGTMASKSTTDVAGEQRVDVKLALNPKTLEVCQTAMPTLPKGRLQVPKGRLRLSEG